jgi:hypothetical protein
MVICGPALRAANGFDLSFFKPSAFLGDAAESVAPMRYAIKGSAAKEQDSCCRKDWRFRLMERY